MKKELIESLLMAIQVQLWNYRGRNHEKPTLIVHPELLWNAFNVRLTADDKRELYGVEVKECAYLKENEFIIGQKFEVGED